jgi:hypothetical protein
MLVEGVCDHCGNVLLPEVNYATLDRSDVVYCPHCDRPHGRANCGKCDVMFAWAPSDIEGERGAL